MKETASDPSRVQAAADPAAEAPRFRPIQRFWPYVDLAEEPTDEEIAAIDPDLRAELFGPESRPFSITIAFPRFVGEDYAAAVALAKKSAEYQETGRDEAFRHRARFRPREVEGLRDLWSIVGRLHEVEVLVDDRPVPYARTLWLPLCWFLLFR